MSILHTVNKSPFTHSTLTSCTAVCRKGDALLLIEDGVYGALPSAPTQDVLKQLNDGGVHIAVLRSDVDARGLNGKTMEWIDTVDYEGFVMLAAEMNTSQSWY